jgi:hypothetical protein
MKERKSVGKPGIYRSLAFWRRKGTFKEFAELRSWKGS